MRKRIRTRPVDRMIGTFAALDAEERGSHVYAGLVRRVGQLSANDADLSGPLAA